METILYIQKKWDTFRYPILITNLLRLIKIYSNHQHIASRKIRV